MKWLWSRTFFESTPSCRRLVRPMRRSSLVRSASTTRKEMFSSASCPVARWSTWRGAVHACKQVNVLAFVSCFSATCTVTGFVLRNRPISSTSAFTARCGETKLPSLSSSHCPRQCTFVLSSCTVISQPGVACMVETRPTVGRIFLGLPVTVDNGGWFDWDLVEFEGFVSPIPQCAAREVAFSCHPDNSLSLGNDVSDRVFDVARKYRLVFSF